MDEGYRVDLELEINTEAMQALQDSFCKANDMYIMCVSKTQGQVTSFSGTRPEEEFVDRYFSGELRREIVDSFVDGNVENVVERYGTERILAHEENICKKFIAELEKIPEVTVYRSKNASYVPIVSFNIDGFSSEEAANLLAEKGYCLRAGYHCAALAHASLGTKNGTVRFAPSVFNTETEVKNLVLFVKTMKNLQNS